MERKMLRTVKMLAERRAPSTSRLAPRRGGAPDEVQQVLAQGRQGPAFTITEEHLSPLPEPVQRFLRAVGVVGSRNIRTAHLKQKGFLRQGQKWLPFRAEQWFVTSPPGFVWRARVPLGPGLLSLSVSDAFVNGHGRLEAKLLSVFTVAQASGPEADRGELLRYLGEMAWLPTAWLSSYLEWEGIDARAAKVTLRLADLAASAMLHFDGAGRLCRVSAPRPREEGGRFVLRDWSGHFDDYRPVGRLLVPFTAKAVWHLGSGDLEYFRGEVTRLEHEA